MAWTTPMTFVPNSVLTAAQLNTFLRDNVMESMPGTATTSGRYFVTSATNRIAEAIPNMTYVDTSDTTTSNDFADLLVTVGPSVTVTTQTRALVCLFTGMQISTSGASWMAYEVSGATQQDPSDHIAVMQQRTTLVRLSNVFLQEGLTPGSNTFTAKYRVTGTGTGTFVNRQLSVMPF